MLEPEAAPCALKHTADDRVCHKIGHKTDLLPEP